MPTMRVALQRLPSAWATTPEGNCLWRLQKKRPLEGGEWGPDSGEVAGYPRHLCSVRQYSLAWRGELRWKKMLTGGVHPVSVQSRSPRRIGVLGISYF
eukprot:s867_g11.t1